MEGYQKLLIWFLAIVFAYNVAMEFVKTVSKTCECPCADEGSDERSID